MAKVTATAMLRLPKGNLPDCAFIKLVSTKSRILLICINFDLLESTTLEFVGRQDSRQSVENLDGIKLFIVHSPCDFETSLSQVIDQLPPARSVAASHSGLDGLIAIPAPSSNPPQVAKSGAIRRRQWK
jgi:hypothetical protein